MRRVSSERTSAGDAGFTLIETVVAMAVFAVLVSSALGIVVRTGQGASENRSRVIAAGLAGKYVEAARGTPVASLDSATYSYTDPNNSRVFTIAQTIGYVGADGTTSACSSSTSLQYKVVSVSVTWADMQRTTKPVKADTLITATATGAVAVTVLKADGTPQAGMPVTLAPNGIVRTTDATGCTVFDQLSGGVYTVSATRAGYTDPTGLSTASATVTAVARQTTLVTLTYDAATTLTFRAVTSDGSANLSATWAARIPAEVRPVTATSSYAAKTTTLPGTLSNVYPGVYTNTAGPCPLGSVSLGSVPGATVDVPVRFTQAGLDMAVLPLAAGPITAVSLGGGICPVNTVLVLGTMSAGPLTFTYHLDVALPNGTWLIRWPTLPLGVLGSLKCAQIDLGTIPLVSNIPLANFIAALVPFGCTP